MSRECVGFYYRIKKKEKKKKKKKKVQKRKVRKG